MIGAFILTPLGEILITAIDRIGINAPGVKAVFYGLLLMIIISVVPNGVWPWIVQRFALVKRQP